MLKSITLQKLRNSDFIQFFSDLFSILSKHNPARLGIEPQISPVAEQLEKIKSLHGASKSSTISKELEDIDARRDNCITGIQAVITGYTYHYDEETKKAAELLANKLENYGSSIARQSYTSETSAIESISTAFTTQEKYITALSKLALSEWVVKMKEENDFFNKRYLDRVDEKAEQPDNKVIELRRTTIENYYELRNHLNAHATLNQEAYKGVMTEINELIDKYRGIVNRRRNNKNNEEETPAE